MRYIVTVVLAGLVVSLALVGCISQSTEDARITAVYLDGKTVTDRQGCVYTVTQNGGRGSATVLLRFVSEISAPACSFTGKDTHAL